MSRIYNFSAGPAVLPKEVLKQAQAEMLDYQGRGLSVMEMSHRSAYWPDANSDPSRPAPIRADGIPVLVLGATADPVTPAGNGTNVFQHLSDGYLITINGGPHVTYGYGNPCPDDLVVDFLVNGKTPSARTTTCDGRLMDSYVPLAPGNADSFVSLAEAFASFELEMDYLPEYYYWSGYEPLQAGCPQGGTLQAESTDEGIAISLFECAFSAGFQLTGTGSYNFINDTFKLTTTTSGKWMCDQLKRPHGGNHRDRRLLQQPASSCPDDPDPP